MNKLLALSIYRSPQDKAYISQSNLYDVQAKFYSALTVVVIIIAVGIFIFLVKKTLSKK